MHIVLNLADLFLNLWRGKFACGETDSRTSWYWAVLKGDVWKKHGADVARCTPYLPGSFDRPPRNPAEKINSGYKAWEYLLYLFALGPALFYKVLPDDIWQSFCKLVAGIRIIYQKRILASQLALCHKLLIEFTAEFETLYVQRRTDRIHMVRHSIHILCHYALEVFRIGPGACSSQWTMERTIGNLTQEIKQYSTVYPHLGKISLKRAQVNALEFIIPGLDEAVQRENYIPKGALDLGGQYVLLRARSSSRLLLVGPEADALKNYLIREHAVAVPSTWKPFIIQWARLRLPNGLVARSAWRECLKPMSKVRMARNVKASVIHECTVTY
ncbi:hypothetical protein BDZ89DRAFT_937108, partial [Hymenopellis radicata]